MQKQTVQCAAIALFAFGLHAAQVFAQDIEVRENLAYKSGSGLTDYERERCLLDLYLPAATDPDVAIAIGYESAVCSPYLLAKKKIATLVSHGFDRNPYLRLRIKAYVYDHRYEPRMISDITRRATKEFIRLGILNAGKTGREDKQD